MIRPTALRCAVAFTLLVAIAPAAAAQVPQREPTFSFLVPGGTLNPTGAQGRVIDDARVTALQAAWALRPGLALTGTFAWAHSRNLAMGGAPRVDILSLDVGLERRLFLAGADRRYGVAGFAGTGAGARSYDQRGAGMGATTTLAGYVSAGGEVRVSRVALRLEVRDYVGRAASLAGARDRGVGNDVVVVAGLRLARRR